MAFCKYCEIQKEESDCKTHKFFNKKLRRIQENGEFLNEFYKTAACTDCGETNPIVLEFDHVRGKKLGRIARLARDGSLEDLKLEIAKCEVVCANCHRIRTHKQGDWANKKGIHKYIGV
tara:strand:- start:340 stop:696 length:357 start_codon:yes stop_codon:yes gene_type:complete